MCATARAYANLVAAPGDIDLGCAGSYAEGSPLACVVQEDGAMEVEVRANTGGRCVLLLHCQLNRSKMCF